MSSRFGNAAPKIEVCMRLIGPHEADMLLKRNRGNRKIRPNWLRQLVADMLADRFVTNGDSVRIAVDGTLLDKQHTLTAIKITGKSYWFPVVTGLPLNVQGTIDIGAKRHIADGLHFDGVPVSNPKDVGAIGRAFILAEGTSSGKPTNTEIANLIKEDPASLDDAAKRAAKLRTEKYSGGVGLWGAAYLNLRRIDRPAAEEFFNQLETLVDQSEGSPVLLAARIFKGAEYRHLTNHAALLRAALWQIYAIWNAWRDGRKLTRRVSTRADGQPRKVVPR